MIKVFWVIIWNWLVIQIFLYLQLTSYFVHLNNNFYNQEIHCLFYQFKFDSTSQVIYHFPRYRILHIDHLCYHKFLAPSLHRYRNTPCICFHSYISWRHSHVYCYFWILLNRTDHLSIEGNLFLIFYESPIGHDIFSLLFCNSQYQNPLLLFILVGSLN